MVAEFSHKVLHCSIRRYALISLGLFLMNPTAVSASDQNRYRDWIVLEDEGSSNCLVTSSSRSKKAKVELARVDIFPRKTAIPTDKANAVMIVRLPLGADISSPVSFGRLTGNQAVSMRKLVWQSCNEQHCLASTSLSGRDLKNFRRWNAFHIRYRPLPGSRKLAVPVSLMGFSAALNKLEKCDKG